MIKCRTDGTSAFNTRTARRCLPRLDPARREGEVEEDSIQQQHNGVVVVEERGNPAGLHRAPTGEEMCHGREREATKGLRYDCSSFSPLYIGPRERGRAQPCPLLQGRGAAKDGEESILPKAPRRCLPPLGLFPFPLSWRMGLLGLVPLAHIGQGAPPTAYVAPRGRWTPRWTPGPLSALPVQYR